MKYNIPFGVVGEICKYLSYNDIEKVLKTKLFELDIDVLYHMARRKSKLLAEMAINSSFNYEKNKNLSYEQKHLLFIEHLKILKTHMSYTTFYKLRTIDYQIWDLERDLSRVLQNPDSYRKPCQIPELLDILKAEPIYHEIVRKRLIGCPCPCRTVYKCCCMYILINAHKTKLHTDIRDPQSFISPKKLKLYYEST